MSMSIAAIGGPAIGGMLYGFASIEVFLIVHMVAYMIAFILESTMDFKLYSKKQIEEQESVGMFKSIKEGFLYAKTKKAVSTVLWVALWINFFLSVINVGGTYILVETLKIKSQHIGVIESAGAVGMLLASIFLSTRKQSKYPLLQSKRFIILMAATVGLTSVPLWTDVGYLVNVIYFTFIFFSFSVFGVFTNTPIGVMLQTEVEEEYRGRVFGILEAMSMAMMPLGTIIFGVLFDRVDAQWVLLGSCIALLIITFYMMRPSIIKQVYPDIKENNIKLKEKVQHS